jgi:hypothetical protein
LGGGDGDGPVLHGPEFGFDEVVAAVGPGVWRVAENGGYTVDLVALFLVGVGVSGVDDVLARVVDRKAGVCLEEGDECAESGDDLVTRVGTNAVPG